MKHINKIKVYHQNTDCYGVVWHGEYLKWFEIGRVEYSEMIGINFNLLQKADIQLPVVEINCRYKSPARLFDILIIETTLQELKSTSMTFSHKITNETTGKFVLSASTTVVTTNSNGKLYRKIPDELYEYLKNDLCNDEILV